MISITSLWLPIVLSAVFVFIASSIIHMLLQYHSTDFKKLPDEDALRGAIRNANVAPGDYMFPHAASAKDMGSPEMTAKCNEGPVGMVTVMPSGPPAMGKNLVMWFVFSLVIGLFAAYVASRTLAPGAEYLTVFRVTGTVAFLSYGAAHATDSIWMGRAWGSTIKNIFDALIYGLMTAGAFGWLWPDA